MSLALSNIWAGQRPRSTNVLEETSFTHMTWRISQGVPESTVGRGVQQQPLAAAFLEYFSCWKHARKGHFWAVCAGIHGSMREMCLHHKPS